MNDVLIQFEQLYETKLTLNQTYLELLPFVYEYKQPPFCCSLASASPLSEVQVHTLGMALKLASLGQNSHTLEQCFEKALYQSVSFEDARKLEEGFSEKNQAFTLFIIEGQVNSMMMDFIHQLKEEKVLLILKEERIIGLMNQQEAKKSLLQMIEMIESELMVKVKVMGSPPFVEIQKIAETFRAVVLTSQMAKLYFDHRKIVMTSDLGLAHLLKNLDDQTSELIIKDLLKGKTTLEFSEEDLKTIHSFFENHLNIAETARQLFVHRNTLIYRLDKYRNLSGLDIRRFDEAVLLKISLMMLQLKNR